MKMKSTPKISTRRRSAKIGSRRSPLSLGASALAAVSALAVVTAAVKAGSFFWAGDNANAWNAVSGTGGTNWSSSGASNQGTAGLPGSGDDVFFAMEGASNLSSTLGQNFSIQSLTFNSNVAGAITIASGGGGTNTLTIGSGGITDNGLSAETLSAPVQLGASQTWVNNTANPLTVSGVISDATGNDLTIAGAGNIIFKGANTYSGDTTIATGSLTLAGSGALASSNIKLGAGTTLTLDNTTSGNSNSRLSTLNAINSAGGNIVLLGNGTTQSAGTLDVQSGATLVSTSTASGSTSLTFGNTLDTASISRETGGTVRFAAGSGSTIKLPNLSSLPAGGLTNGIIAGWAFTGTANGTDVNFATLDANNNVVPLTSYAQLTADSLARIIPFPGPLISTNNVQYNATGNNTAEINSSVTVNSLHMTGGSPESGVSQPPSGSFYNGITFGTADGPFSQVTLTIGTGGIISSGATGIAHYNNHSDIGNMAFIGYLFGDAGGFDGYNGSVTVATDVPDLVVFTDSNLSIASTIVDNGHPVGLTKSGPGILDLSDGNQQASGGGGKPTNSFSGAVTINEGVLLINAVGQLGTSNIINFNGGELRTYAGGLTTSGTWNVGTQGGTFSYTGGNTVTLANLIQGTGGFTYYARNAGNSSVTSGGNLTLKNVSGPGGGTSDTYQGATSFIFSYPSSGTVVGNIQFGAVNQVPATSQVIMNTVLDQDGYPVTANISNVGVDMNSLSQSFGSIEGNVNVKNLSGGATLTLGGNNLSTVYTGSLLGGNGNLVKVGTGTQTLSGANTYTGTTSIIGGTLLIGSGTGTTSSASLGNTAVTVGNGVLAGTLGGNGSVSGTVTLSATGTLAPAMSPTTANTFQIKNNLTINAGASFNLNLGAPGTGTSDRITITGSSHTITINGNGSIPDVVNINQLSGFTTGNYTLLTQPAGTISNLGNETFTVNAPDNFNYSVAVVSNSLVLTVSTGSAIETWTGLTSGAWLNSAGGPANWAGSGGTKYVDPDNVVFDDTLTSHPTIAVDATGVHPNSLLFNAGSTNYTINGPGTVTVTTNVTQQAGANATINANVSAPVTKVSAGTLTIGSTLYTSTSKVDVNGAALVVNGTLATPQLNVNAGSALTVGSGGSIGSANLNLGANATATFNNATETAPALTSVSGNVITLNGTAFSVTAPTSYGGQFAGNGSIVQSSGNTLTLSNSSPSFTGPVTVSNSSTLLLTNTTGSATGSGPVTITSGTLDGTGAASGLVTIGASGTLQGTGAIGTTGGVNLSGTLSPAGSGAFGTITLGALTINGGAKLNFDVSTSATDLALVQGATTMSGSETINVFFPTQITTGTYVLLTSPSISGTPTFTVNPSGPGMIAGVGYNIVKTPTELILSIQGQSQTWTGAVNSNWDFSTGNWVVKDVNQNTIGNQYIDPDIVLFDDTGINTHIALTSNVAPAAGMIFSNSSSGPAYTLTSTPTASIGGPGGVTLTNTGSVQLDGPNTFSGPAVIDAGTLLISSDAAYGKDFGSLGAFPGVATPNSIVIADGATLGTSSTAGSFMINGNRGIAVGNTTGTGATINVSTNIVLTYGGVIANFNSQAGILNKTGIGELDLAGNNTFTGGLNVNGGTVKLLTTTAAGAGAIALHNAGSTLIVSSGGGTTANSLNLGTGTVLATGSNSETLSGSVTLPNGGSVTLDEFDPSAATPTSNRLNFTRVPAGTGVNIAVNNFAGANVPDAAANTDGVWFSGTGSSLTGTVTVGQRAKAVLTTSGATGSPIGSAGVVLTGGVNSGGNTGTYSLLGLANNSGANTTLGNNVSLTGTGNAYLSVMSGAGKTIGLGNLTIGANQALGVVSANSTQATVSFTGVTLTGGNATLKPGLVGNSAYTSAENLTLGPVGQNVSGSGLIVSGKGVVTMTGTSTYSGATSVIAGMLAINGVVAGTGVTATNATLEGIGTVNSTGGVILGDNLGLADSIIRAGTETAIGTFNLKSLTLGTDAAFDFQANFDTGINAISLLKIANGSLVLGNGVFPATFNDQGTSGGAGVTAGEVIPIVQVTGSSAMISGSFEGYPEGSPVDIDGTDFTIHYGTTQVTLTATNTPSQVPEPGSLFMALNGVGLLLGLGRFRPSRRRSAP